jgi:hypothetical protein
MGGQQQEEETEEQQEDVEQVDDSAVVRHISATDMFHPSKQVIEVLAASPSIGPDMAYLSSSTAMIFIALYTTNIYAYRSAMFSLGAYKLRHEFINFLLLFLGHDGFVIQKRCD